MAAMLALRHCIQTFSHRQGRSVAAHLCLVAAGAMWLSGCNAAGLETWRRTQIEPGPGRIQITWIGVAGVLIDDGDTALLIDPFVSRYGLLPVGLRRKLEPMHADIAVWTERWANRPVSAVIVSHSHYDHAMDAPWFAAAFSAPVLGSASTARIVEGADLPEIEAVVVDPNRSYRFGAFSIRMLESRHGPALFGRIPYPGEIEEPLEPPATANAYRLGMAYSIHITHPAGSLLHHASAGWVEGMFEGIEADTVLLGVAGRAATTPYLEAVLGGVGARRLIPVHFDDFFRKAGSEPTPLKIVRLNEFFESVAAHDPPLVVESLPLGRAVPLFE